MAAAHADQIISGYMSRLELAVRSLPDGRGAELLEVFREHIAEARARLVDESDADLLNILERLGEPADIVGEEHARVSAGSSQRPVSGNALEIVAIVALLVVWPVGVVLLWISDAWSTRDKLIGTLLPPGGTLGVVVFGVLAAGALGNGGCVNSVSNSASADGVAGTPTYGTTCPNLAVTAAVDIGNVLMIVLAVILVVLPLLTAIYLGMRLGHSGSQRPGRVVPDGA